MPAPLPSLAGQLLLASPQLNRSLFKRAVILLTSHGLEEGTQGFILNRPVPDLTLRDLIPSPDFAGLQDLPIYDGGPVNPSELMLIALRWDAKKAALAWQLPLGIQGAKKAQAAGWEIRACTGYTGWAPRQLEDELGQASWLLLPPSPHALAAAEKDHLWPLLLRHSPDPAIALLAESPEDPHLN